MLRKQSANVSPANLFPGNALAICLAVLLAGNATPPALAEEAAGDNLPAVQVFKHVKDKYASMATYSDEGCVVTARGTIINFSTRLARTNFYLIECRQVGGTSYAIGSQGSHAAWSSGAGDFVRDEAGVSSQSDREMALAHAAAFSGGATATVPRLFFDQQWVDQPLEDSVFTVDRQADEKVGDISCYVFARGAMGATNTLWIGKQDFLIHQTRTTVIREPMPAFTATETHTNIVLNRKFSRPDFIPSTPLFQSAND
jgi:hypothetical protein